MVIERVVEEAVDELSGRSTRKWGLMLCMFVLGAATLTVLLVRAGKRLATGTDVDMPTTAPEPHPQEARSPMPSTSSKWSDRRARIAHSDAAMRARVGHAASHLDPRRFGRKKDEAAEVAAGEASADQPVGAS